MSLVLATGPASDTIFALASGTGRSAIAVVRISGTRAGVLLQTLCGTLPLPRVATLRSVRDASRTPIDQAIVLWFPAPASYTGEDSAELHLHGGNAVLDAVTRALVQAGARPADPGEFTRRAVTGGKMDLLAAEAVADLIDSETEHQRVQALRQLGGSHGAVLTDWSSRLTRCLAWQETSIDFVEEDLPASVHDDIRDELASLIREIGAQIGASATGERLRRGLLFAIVGAPNVGKSSLLNTLAGRDIAIVSPHPGTTRDAVQVDLVLAGIPVTLVDTAGLRETDDPVEAEGIRRARAQAAAADFVVTVVDAPACEQTSADSLTIMNKVDLSRAPPGMIGLSALTRAGVTELLDRLTEEAKRLAGFGNAPAFNRARHAAALRDAATALEAATISKSPELCAEEIRTALKALGRISGKVSNEAVLDVVFASFCIGK